MLTKEKLAKLDKLVWYKNVAKISLEGDEKKLDVLTTLRRAYRDAKAQAEMLESEANSMIRELSRLATGLCNEGLTHSVNSCGEAQGVNNLETSVGQLHVRREHLETMVNLWETLYGELEG